MTRRELLAATAGAASAAAQSRYAPKLAAQVYVWTQHFNQRKIPLADGIEEIFATTRKAGFTRLELVSQFVRPDLFDRTARLLKKHRLELPIVYNGGPFHDPSLAGKTMDDMLEAARAARKLGAAYLNTNPNPKPGRARKTDQELETQAALVNKLGAAVRQEGLRLILHHHDPEMKEDARELRHLVNNTDPKLAGFCIDLDWVIRGGHQFAPILELVGTRAESFHLRNARGGVWTESLADGEYDFASVRRHLEKIGFRGYLTVELAVEKATRVTRSLEENLRLSREYAVKVFGAK